MKKTILVIAILLVAVPVLAQPVKPLVIIDAYEDRLVTVEYELNADHDACWMMLRDTPEDYWTLATPYCPDDEGENTCYYVTGEYCPAGGEPYCRQVKMMCVLLGNVRNATSFVCPTD